MSELGTTIYTVLLGWMRAVNDWFWGVLAGEGRSVYTSILTNWKTWLLVIVVVGLAVDFLVWMVRWRPLRLIFGKRVIVPDDEDEWNDEEPYYGPDDDEDVSAMERADWTDVTLRTLSEVDPDWADNLSLETPEVLETDPPMMDYSRRRVEDPWAPTPDELEDVYDDVPEPEMEESADVYDDTPDWAATINDEPDLPDWAKPDAALEDAGDVSPEETHVFAPARGARAVNLRRSAPEFVPEPTFEPEPEPMPEPVLQPETPEFAQSADAPVRRRRRSIRESTRTTDVQTEERYLPRRAERMDVRPARLVMPEQERPASYTAAPVKRKRLLTLSAQDDDAIAGLPPMPTDGAAFHDAAMPDGTRRRAYEENE